MGLGLDWTGGILFVGDFLDLLLMVLLLLMWVAFDSWLLFD